MLDKRVDRTLATIGKWAASIISPLEKRVAELEQRQFKFIRFADESPAVARGFAGVDLGGLRLPSSGEQLFKRRRPIGGDNLVTHKKSARRSERLCPHSPTPRGLPKIHETDCLLVT
jgi:hypothetical protein